MQNSITITRERFDKLMDEDPMFLMDEAKEFDLNKLFKDQQKVKDHVWALLYNELNSDAGLDNVIDCIVNYQSVLA